MAPQSKSIQVKLGKLTSDISIINGNLYVETLKHQFKFTTEQRALIVKGLRHTNSSKEFLFKLSTDLGFELLALQNVDELQEDEVYEIILEDVRNACVKMLSEKELAEIKKSFKAMDLDGNGVVEFKEIDKYYHKLMQDKIDFIEKSAKQKVEKFPNKKARVERMRDICVKGEKNRCLRRIKAIKESDVDKSQTVEWNEWLNFEANRIIKKKRYIERVSMRN